MKKHPYITLGTLYTVTILLLLALTLESCASRCGQQRRYWSNHRVV